MSDTAGSDPPVEPVETRPGVNGGTLTPWRKGQSGNPRGMSAERRALYDAIETNEVPKVLAMLGALYTRGIQGDDIAARLWLDQVRGPVKARKDDEIERAVEEKLLELIQEARRRRGGGGTSGAPISP